MDTANVLRFFRKNPPVDIILQTKFFEVDEKFSSRDEWEKYYSKNASVFSTDFSDEFGKRILENGFIEPLSHASIAKSQISSGKNWREDLVANGLNSRSRAVMHLIEEQISKSEHQDVRIFATEGLTAFALKMRGIFPRFLGSEYGFNETEIRKLAPIPHQDLTALTFNDNSFDLVTTNEVLEHVPDLDKALKEIARILIPGGWHIGTHPFYFMDERGALRAALKDGKVVHLMEPEYHGNPVDPKGGSLVFETPGWDILQRAREAGFREAHMRFIASEKFGFLTENTGVFVLCCKK